MDMPLRRSSYMCCVLTVHAQQVEPESRIFLMHLSLPKIPGHARALIDVSAEASVDCGLNRGAFFMRGPQFDSFFGSSHFHGICPKEQEPLLVAAIS